MAARVEAELAPHLAALARETVSRADVDAAREARRAIADRESGAGRSGWYGPITHMQNEIDRVSRRFQDEDRMLALIREMEYPYPTEESLRSAQWLLDRYVHRRFSVEASFWGQYANLVPTEVAEVARRLAEAVEDALPRVHEGRRLRLAAEAARKEEEERRAAEREAERQRAATRQVTHQPTMRSFQTCPVCNGSGSCHGRPRVYDRSVDHHRCSTCRGTGHVILG